MQCCHVFWVSAVSRSATVACIRSTRQCRCCGRPFWCLYRGTRRVTTSHSCIQGPPTSSWSGPVPARDTDPQPHSTSPPTYQVCTSSCYIKSEPIWSQYVISYYIVPGEFHLLWLRVSVGVGEGDWKLYFFAFAHASSWFYLKLKYFATLQFFLYLFNASMLISIHSFPKKILILNFWTIVWEYFVV